MKVTDRHFQSAGHGRRSRAIATTAVLVNVAGFMPALFVSVLAVRIGRDISLGASGLGAAVGLHFGIAAIASRMSGRFADRVGWAKAAAVACSCSSISLAGIGAVAGSYAVLVTFLMIGGVGLALALPSGNLALLQNVSARYQGLTFGAKQAAAPAASFAAAASLPLFAMTIGWRWAFAAAAGVPIAAAARVIGEFEEVRRTDRAEVDEATPIARFPLRVVAAGAALATLAVGSIGTFFVLWMTHEGWSDKSAAAIAAVASGVGIVVRVSAGWIADRRGYEPLHLVSVFLCAGAVGLVGLALGLDLLVPLLAVVTYAALWGWSGLFHYGIAGRYRETAGEATGVAQSGLTSGMAVGSLIFGAVAESFGYSAAWSVTAACALAGASLIAVGARDADARSVRELLARPSR